MKSRKTFSVMLGLFCFLIFSNSQAGEYEDRISSHYLGTWKGSFEHLYLKSDAGIILDVTVELRSLNLSPDAVKTRLSDLRPEGEITLTSGDRTEKFGVTEVKVMWAYNSEGQRRPQDAILEIDFENDKKQSSIKFPKGLFFYQYSKIRLGEETFGSLSKQ